MESGYSDLEGKPSINDESDSVSVVIRKLKRFPITVEPLGFAAFLADSLADSITINFILMRTCENHLRFNKSECSDMENNEQVEASVQPYAALIITAMNLLSILLPAITSLFIGPWSDYNGRKLVILIPITGYVIKYISLGTLSLFPSLGPELFLISVIPVALTGGVVNFVNALYSYMSDITDDGNRSFRISVLESIMYLGTNVGLLSSSYIFKAGGDNGYTLVFGTAGIVLFTSLIYSCIFVEESVRITEGGRGLRHIFDLNLFKEMFRTCVKKRDGYQRTVIFLLVATLTLNIGTMYGESNVLFLFARLRFKWKIKDYTLWGSSVIASAFIGILVGAMILTKWLKIKDAVIGIGVYALKAIGLFFIAFIPSDKSYLLYLYGVINIFSGLSGPIGRALLSKVVSKEELGKVFALTGSCEALFPLATTPLYTILYNDTLQTVPSAFLFLSALIFTLCCFFYVFIYVIQKRNTATPMSEPLIEEQDEEVNVEGSG